MTPAAPVAEAPRAAQSASRPEFDLSTVQLGKTSYRASVNHLYPKAQMAPKPAPPKKATPPPPPIDKVIATAAFSAAEKIAVEKLELKLEAFLSKNEVKSKYRALVRKFHPDRHPVGLSDLERRLLTEKFQLIHESYTLLEDVFRRQIPKQQ